VKKVEKIPKICEKTSPLCYIIKEDVLFPKFQKTLCKKVTYIPFPKFQKAQYFWKFWKRNMLLHCKAKYFFFEILEKEYFTSLQKKVFFEIWEKEYLTSLQSKVFFLNFGKGICYIL
jgi:hypothetical protein